MPPPFRFTWRTLCRVHESLRTSPAVAQGIADRVWSIGDMVDAALATQRPGCDCTGSSEAVPGDRGREGLSAASPTVAAPAATVAATTATAGNVNVAAKPIIAPRLAQRPSDVVAVEQGADDDAGKRDVKCSRWYEVSHACHYSRLSRLDKSGVRVRTAPAGTGRKAIQGRATASLLVKPQSQAKFLTSRFV